MNAVNPHPPAAAVQARAVPVIDGAAVTVVADVTDLASAADRPALDATALGRLRELDPEGRSGVVQRVLLAYESSLVRVLALVKAQDEQPLADAKVLAENAHMLKSSSASVGAMGLARLCEAMEARLRATQTALPDDCARFMQEIHHALIAVRATLAA
jgi:histidine phosphotransfer protein HptB